MNCTAIVLAAGQGKRMKSKIQKQFLLLKGKPVLFYSISCFEKSSEIDDIIIVTGAESVEYVKREIVEPFGFQKVKAVVTGGKERYDSVYEGLKACQNCDYVFIHDGARPFVTEEMMTDEEISSIQSVLEKEAEDLNGDGEIHVEMQNYTIPQGDSADPQLVAAGQTKLTVDIQDGTSMIFFLSPGCYESYKDSGVLPADESEYIKFSDCTGYEEAGSPKELGDLMGALRLVEDTKLKKDQNKMDYYEANKELFEKFTEKTLRGE